MKSDWFSYGEIRYNSRQILFLLEHKHLLESGVWPPQCVDSGYIGSSKARIYKNEATFVKPVVIIAELNVRLSCCSEDGRLVVERYTMGYDEIDLADMHKMDYWDVISRISTSLSYIRGKCRRWMSCDNCLVEGCKSRGRRPGANYKDYKAGRLYYLKRRGKL